MIKKIAVVSKQKTSKDLIESIRKFGFEYTDSSPDIVFSLGGDGTYLYSERKFPGIPKILIRDSMICEKCDIESFEENILDKLGKGGYRIKENLKLEAIVKKKGKKDRKFTCTNDFVIRNKKQTRALRFQVEINQKNVNGTLIGDGIVVSTPFGSTGYFHSITGGSFKKGIGVAFNNLTKIIRNTLVNEESKIIVKIVRDDAVFSSDNDPSTIVLTENDTVEIRKSKEVARIVRLTYK